jgi:fatty acid-binding protein DegV
MVDGQLRLLGPARSFRGGLKRVLNLVEEMGPLDHLAIIHTRSQEKAEEMANWLAENLAFPRERIWVRETGAVLASHAGEGAVGVLAITAHEGT